MNASILLNYLCGDLGVNCSIIEATGKDPGTYGLYSPCTDSIKLSFEMNVYWESQLKASRACNFGMAATTHSVKPALETSALLLNCATSGTQSLPSATRGQTSTVISGNFRPLVSLTRESQNSSPSGGVIGGIVGGVLGVCLLVSMTEIFLLWRMGKWFFRKGSNTGSQSKYPS